MRRAGKSGGAWGAVLSACALMLMLGAAPSAGAAALRVSAQPALYPHFSPRVSNYVARCVRRKPVRLSVKAPAGVRVAVDRGRARTGAFRAAMRVKSGQSFRFVVSRRHGRQRYYVRCLPGDFPKWKAERSGGPQAAFYVVAPCCDGPTYVTIFDTNGVPVWWVNTHRPPLDASLLPNGHVVWAQQRFVDLAPGVSSGAYEEHKLDGKLVRTFRLPGGNRTDRHELQILPNGN